MNFSHDLNDTIWRFSRIPGKDKEDSPEPIEVEEEEEEYADPESIEVEEEEEEEETLEPGSFQIEEEEEEEETFDPRPSQIEEEEEEEEETLDPRSSQVEEENVEEVEEEEETSDLWPDQDEEEDNFFEPESIEVEEKEEATEEEIEEACIEIIDEMIEDDIFDIIIDFHRAAKLGYLDGKLSVLKPPTLKKKRKKDIDTVICRNCKYNCGPTVFAKHIDNCIFNQGRPRPPVNYYAEKQSGVAPSETKKQKAKPATQNTKKANAKKTYPDLATMTLVEKKKFFNKFCGVKLKCSKYQTLCDKESSACKKHTDKDRASIRQEQIGSEAG